MSHLWKMHSGYPLHSNNEGWRVDMFLIKPELVSPIGSSLANGNAFSATSGSLQCTSYIYAPSRTLLPLFRIIKWPKAKQAGPSLRYQSMPKAWSSRTILPSREPQIFKKQVCQCLNSPHIEVGIQIQSRVRQGIPRPALPILPSLTYLNVPCCT